MDLVALIRELPERPEVLIEAPKGTMLKRTASGELDFISPLPCPYNYGCVPGTRSGDGMELDAIVLGTRRPAGARMAPPIRAVVVFVDEGREDPKLVLSSRPLTRPQRLGLQAFFTTYARAKRALSRMRGGGGQTRFVELVELGELAELGSGLSSG